MKPVRESNPNVLTEDGADEENALAAGSEDEEEAEDEVDMEKTKEGLWSLLTG